MTSDADGNTLTDTSGRSMTWDSQNRLASCVYNGTTSKFTYGADGLRRQATVNGVTTDYAYDGQTLVQEGFASGGTLSTVKATYLQGPRGSECRIDETQQTEGYYHYDATGNAIKNTQGQPIIYGRGVTKWYVYDGLGSVVGEVDPSGSLTSSPKYDVYGLVRSNPGTASSAMGFVGGLGHLSEAGTGLIYMRARYYDPSLGRFASEDPALNGGNWFVYCDDSPVNGIDFTGKESKHVDIDEYQMGVALAATDCIICLALGKAFSAGSVMAQIAIGITSMILLARAFGATKDESIEHAGEESAIGLLAGVLAGERTLGRMGNASAQGIAAAAVVAAGVYSIELIANL